MMLLTMLTMQHTSVASGNDAASDAADGDDDDDDDDDDEDGDVVREPLSFVRKKSERKGGIVFADANNKTNKKEMKTKGEA